MTSAKATFIAVVLTALPSLGYAGCTGYGHQEASMSCADGTVYDTETRTCVAVSG